MNKQNDKQVDKRISSFLSAVDSSAIPPDKQSLNKLQKQSTAEFLASSADRILQPEKIRTISLWRTIMKSRITKFAAAAVIIIVVMAGLYYYTGSFHGTTAAFATSDVITAMKQVQWTHATLQWIDHNNVPVDKLKNWDGLEFWQSIDPYRSISIEPVSYTHLTLPTTPYV